ncbi:MAG: NAD(P)-dependent oxidoreductase [Deltaproteobacteria bacterium]|jgi:dTDP-4-dehydrorhamnose reductase|nr:NAD(P)-dependent oxidoreductase [Deltaproteobacteria bacterium]
MLHPKPILLLGKDGQLGRALSMSLSPAAPLIAWGRGETDGKDGSLEAKLSLFGANGLSAVVNAAAFTDVEGAEDREDEAMASNKTLPGALAKFCSEKGIFLIHYSTDYVHDGFKEGPYLETDEPNPLNVYGKSKLLGDREITDLSASSGATLDYLIFRTSRVYSVTGRCFPNAVLKKAFREKSLEMDATMVGAPTSAEWLAQVTAFVARDLIRGAEVPKGLYHLTAAGETTYLNLARFVTERARAAGLKTELEPWAITARDPAIPGGKAVRPLNSKLSTRKFSADFKIAPPHWSHHVSLFVENHAALAAAFGH